MKKLLFAVSALAALSLLAPSSGFAQHVYFNQIGLYTTPNALPDPDFPEVPITGTNDVGSTTVFLVLTRAAEGEVLFGAIKAFECRLDFNPGDTGLLFLLSGVLGAPGLNIGDVTNIASGYLEYIVGFAAPKPVEDDESIVLVTFTFLNQNAVPVEVTLGPVETATFPGEMVCQMVFEPNDPPILQRIYSSSGDDNEPVFLFSGVAVPVETESFGAVKALYR